MEILGTHFAKKHHRRNTPTPGIALVAELLDALASRTATAEMAAGRAGNAGNAASQAILITWPLMFPRLQGAMFPSKSLKKIMLFFGLHLHVLSWKS